MAGQIEALMGLVPPEQADQQALARQLRSDRNLGQFMGFSGNQQVQKQGKQMVSDALSGAKGAGTNRERALGRSVAAEKEQYDRGRDTKGDVLAASALEQTLKGYSGIKDFTDADGKPVMYGKNNRTGVFEEVPDTDDLTPYNRYANSMGAGAKGWRSGELLSGAPINTNLVTKEVEAFGEFFPSMAAFKEKYPNERVNEEAKAKSTVKSAITMADEWAKYTTEEVNDRIRGVAELDPVYADSMQNIDTMVSAIDDGAETGQIYSMFTTLTDATSRFESAKAKETLNMLSKYKLTPVSDRDLAELNKAAQPNLTPPEMKEFLLHKREGIARMQQANRVMEKFLRDNRGIPTGAERDALEAEIDTILHEGYNYAFSGSNADQGERVNEDAIKPDDLSVDEWNLYKDNPEALKILMEQ